MCKGALTCRASPSQSKVLCCSSRTLSANSTVGSFERVRMGSKDSPVIQGSVGTPANV